MVNPCLGWINSWCQKSEGIILWASVVCLVESGL